MIKKLVKRLSLGEGIPASHDFVELFQTSFVTLSNPAESSFHRSKIFYHVPDVANHGCIMLFELYLWALAIMFLKIIKVSMAKDMSSQYCKTCMDAEVM